MYARLFPWVAVSTISAILLSGCGPRTVNTAALSPPNQKESSSVTATTPVSAFEESHVSTWAGSMEAGYLDGSFNSARFLKPYGLCQGPNGELLIVDSYSNLLRTSTKDSIRTFAGNAELIAVDGYPSTGYYNGNALDALLNRPRFAATSVEGYVVFSDSGNHNIRILKDNVVRLVAGNQKAGFQDGGYQNAQFHTPSGVAIGEDGTIYVADTLNHCIRGISSDGQVYTLAGTPQEAGFRDGETKDALFCEPNDIHLSPDGALYVVDKGNQRIRKIANNQVTTLAGSGDEKDAATGYIIGGYQDGAAHDARFLYPTGLFITDDNSVYIADTGNNCIRMLSPDGQVSTITGSKMPGNENGSLKTARFNQPLDVYYDNGNLYVSDSYNHVVRLVSLHNVERK